MAVRLFAALDLPDAIAAQILPLQTGVRGAQWHPRENLHVTLRFFGEVREDIARDLDEALEEGLGAWAPFSIQLQGAGAFGRDDPHTLWLGVGESPALRKLAADIERIARRVGLAADTRKFSPHVTIAALRGMQARGGELAQVQAFEARCALFASLSWEVRGFGLYSSWLRRGQPSQYRLEAGYAFRGQTPV
jgi:RNA 2',3'-cyclic 3'-phosphodiesterase